MILWIILFLLIISISFVLAFRSMKDFHEVPQKIKVNYGLFLVRQVVNFNAKILDEICQRASADGGIVSFERLFKGSQTVLTIFGPVNILKDYKNDLNLLELEDYTVGFTNSEVSVWEVGAYGDVFNNLPKLAPLEHFFWQVIPSKGKVQIRAVVSSKDPNRLKILSSAQELIAGGLKKVPRPFSNEQMIEFYKTRSLSHDHAGPILNTEGILQLLKV